MLGRARRRRSASASTTASVAGVDAAGGEQPAEQGRAHVAATDDRRARIMRVTASRAAAGRDVPRAVRRPRSAAPDTPEGSARIGAPRGCRKTAAVGHRTPVRSGEAAGEADPQQAPEASARPWRRACRRPGRARPRRRPPRGSSPRRNTASSTPIEKWAPTSRSLRRSRCS